MGHGVEKEDERETDRVRRVPLDGMAIVGTALVGTAVGWMTRRRTELHYRATARALEDAGLTRDDVDGFMSTGTGVFAPIEVADYSGLGRDGSTEHERRWRRMGVMLRRDVPPSQAGWLKSWRCTYGSTARADFKQSAAFRELDLGGAAAAV